MSALRYQNVCKLKVSKFGFAGSKGILPSSLMNTITDNSDSHIHNTRNEENPHANVRRICDPESDGSPRY